MSVPKLSNNGPMDHPTPASTPPSNDAQAPDQLRLVRTRYGDMFVHERVDLVSKSLLDYGEWAQNELDAFARFIDPGSVVFDIGAYIGSHSRAFSQITGHSGAVFSFEPHPRSFQILLENIRIGPLSNITAIETALGDFDGIAFLNCAVSENDGASHLSQHPATSAHGYRARVQRLDDLLLEFRSKLSFVKIDVEGYEGRVLIGAENIIDKYRPIIYAEANTLTASHSLLGWVNNHDYQAFGLCAKAFNPANLNGATENIFGSALECGLLCIHRDQVARHASSIAALGLLIIRDMDDLAATLCLAPQYIELLAERQRNMRLIGNKAN